MKRSEINAAIAHAEALLARYRFALPPFAGWSVTDWQANRGKGGEIIRAGLGWDITDFGLGRFAETGLTLFTIRNGDAANLGAGRSSGPLGMVYAEKAIIVREGQRCPLHYHFSKTEDIINRGGGVLALELVETGADGKADPSREVIVRTDGMERRFPPHGILRLTPGESVTLVPGLAHAFWAERGDVFVGEVSTVNDDRTDNAFLEPVARFPTIEEDAAPHRMIVGDYAGLA
jgi:D-lyxose ketol-isomerase